MATSRIGISEATSAQKRTLIAASLGWALDAFDVMLYSLVIAHLMTAFGITKAGAGWLSTFTLFASGIGGVLFGFIADRVGRTKALMLSILTYSVCSLGSGLSTSIPMLAFFRFVLGLGMGRMEHGRDAGCRNMAHASSGESHCHCAKFMGMGLRGRCGSCRICSKGYAELALCVLCGYPAGAGDAMDTQERARI